MTSTLAMLGVITALARTLGRPEFGAYGLLVSFSTYLLIAQGSVESAAIKHIAEAVERIDLDRAMTTTVCLYVLFGAVAASFVAGIGILLIPVVGIPDALVSESRDGLLALGVVTFLGWPTKAFQDLLRGTQFFVAAAVSEVAAWLVFAALFATLLIFDAPFWMLVALGGAPPLMVGCAAGVAVAVLRAPFAPRLHLLSRSAVRDFLGISGFVLISSAADLVVTSLDRLVIGAFRSASVVALYEGPVRAHNVVRQVQGVLALTVLPAASGFIARDDRQRLRDLLLRGTRYQAILGIPMIVVFMTLAGPLLSAWLGDEYRAGATALTILVSYWLFQVNANVASAMLLAAGGAKKLAVYSWVVALSNLGLSLALAPSLGLDGVVLGTAIPSAVAFPFLLRMVLHAFPEVTLRDFAREVWIPAYSTGAVLAAALLALRAATSLHGLIPVLAAAGTGVIGYWLVIYTVWLRPNERVLARDLVRTAASRVPRPGRAANG